MRQLEVQARRPWWRWVYRTGLDVSDVVSVESSEMQKRFVAFMGRCRVCSIPRVALVPSCGFDLETVLARQPLPGAAELDLLYVGRLGPWQKATDVLLEGYRLLRESHRLEASLHLVGRCDKEFDSLLTAWRRRVEPATAAGLKIHGPVADRAELMELYWIAKAFVIASRYEGIPNVVAEAASCGCLLVATPVGQVPDMLRAGAQGWLVPIDDALRLADGLAEALRHADHHEARLRRIQAFKRVYSWPDVIDYLVDILKAGRASRTGGPAVQGGM